MKLPLFLLKLGDFRGVWGTKINPSRLISCLHAKGIRRISLGNLLKIAKYVGHQTDDGRHPDAVRGWDKYKTRFIVDGRTFEGEISLKLTQRGDVFYDITKIKDITPGMSGAVLPTSRRSDVVEGNPSTNSISEGNENVNSFYKKVWMM